MIGGSCDHERGTILFIFPAAVVVMFLLAAIVIDSAVTQLRARELETVAATAANDALAALDVGALREGRGVVIDEVAARRVVAASVAAGPLPDATINRIDVTLDAAGRTVIGVTLRLNVDLVMAPSVGSFGAVTIQRTERAVILGSELP